MSADRTDPAAAPRVRLRTKLPRPTDRLPLGAAGLEVSPFCLGRVIDPKAIPAAFDAGINFFFVTADMHWPVYEASRRGLEMLFARKGVRDRVVVAVVSYVTQPVFCYSPFVEAIEAVKGLERVDVTIIGGTYGHELLTRRREYENHRRGTVFTAPRAIGATFHDRDACAYATAGRIVDVAFCRYNPVHRGAERDLFPRVKKRAPTLLFNFLTTQGYLREEAYAQLQLSRRHWRPKVTDYYRFALARPELDGLLCAPSTPAEIRDLARATAAGPLTDEEYTYIRDLADLATGQASLAEGQNAG